MATKAEKAAAAAAAKAEKAAAAQAAKEAKAAAAKAAAEAKAQKAAEEKAAKEAARIEKEAAARTAKAEKARKAAEAKAAKAEAKAIKTAESAELQQVKAAQKAETILLKKQGVPKSVIKAEEKSNKAEYAAAKTTLAAPGKQTMLTDGQTTFFSAASNYSGDVATNVQQALTKAADKYNTLGLVNVSKSGDTLIGIGLDKLVQYDLGEASKHMTRAIDRAGEYVGKTFTPAELEAQKVKIKPVKGADGLFQYKTGSDGKNIYTFFRQDANGNYVGTGVNQTFTPQDDGGFFSSDIGKALMIGGSIALALTPGGQAFAAQIGGALSGGALSGAAAQALGQAAIRGVSTGIITGDVEKGLIAGALSGAGSALNLSGEMSNIFDSVGLGDYKDAFGVITPAAEGAGATGGMLPSLGEGAFDIGGATGAGIVDQAVSAGLPIAEGAAQISEITGGVPTVPSLGEGAFDMGGAVDTGMLQTQTTLPSLGEGAFDVGGAQGTSLMDYTNLNTGAFDMGGAAGTGLLEGAGALGTGLTAKELISGANTARQVAGLLSGAGGGATGGTGAGGLGDLLSGLNLGQVAAPIIDYAQLNKIAQEGQQFGREMAQRAEQIGREAQTPFTPYTLTTGAGTATVAPGSATAAAAAPYEALRQQALTQAQQTLGAINPAQATQQFYQNLEALAAPTRQREQEQLLSSLGARGLLGIGRNLPTAGGAVRGVNPFQESLLAAQEQGRIQQALTAQQYGTSEAARQQGLAQALQAQAMGIDTQTMNQLTQARQLGLDERSLAQANARLRAQSALAGLELRQPYDLLGLEARAAGINQVADIGRGMLGLPTQPGNRAASNAAGLGNILNTIFSNLTSQGMTAEQAADYVNSISSGLDISGESAGTQSLIEQMQQYGIF